MSKENFFRRMLENLSAVEFSGPVTNHGPISVTSGLTDDQFSSLLFTINRGAELMSRMTDAIELLRGDVAALATVSVSVGELLDRLATLLVENAGNATAVREIAGEIRGKRDELAAAVLRNTPEAEPPVEPPVESPVEPVG